MKNTDVSSKRLNNSKVSKADEKRKPSELAKVKNGIPFIELWGIFYILMVCAVTLLFDGMNIFLFGIYFVCALPFFQHLDKYLCVCLLLSTMSYFFLGADEGVWSIYSILAAMMLLHSFSKAKTKPAIRSVLYVLWLVLAVVIAYTHSQYGYSMGMFLMIYNIAIALLIAVSVKANRDTFESFLPKIAAIQLVAYVGLLLLGGYYDGYGYSVSASVNHNTFAASVAVLSVIVFTKIVFFGGGAIYKLAWVLSCVLMVVSGSRNALLAMVLTSVAVYIIFQKQQKRSFSGAIKFLIAAGIILILGMTLLPIFGIDLGRYDYIELVNDGGSNRVAIWEELSPVIWRDYRWFGYGPSHFCSEQIISTHLGLDYKHTHNTIFESWAELGFFGLIPFLLILIYVFKRSRENIKNKTELLLFAFLFFEFLLFGIGESFFANMSMWIVIGLLLSGKKPNDKLKTEDK